MQNKGIFIEPEIEDYSYEDENAKKYFTTTEKDLDELVSHYGYDVDDDTQSKLMTNLTEDGGVQKRIILPGLESDGPVPEKGSVTIHVCSDIHMRMLTTLLTIFLFFQYSLVIEGQDEPFDSTYLRGKSERHRIDHNKLFSGLDIAVRSMKNHEKADFIIRPEYAFGIMVSNNVVSFFEE